MNRFQYFGNELEKESFKNPTKRNRPLWYDFALFEVSANLKQQ